MSASASSVGGKETQLQTEEAWSPHICTNTHTKHQCKGSRMQRARERFSGQNSQIQRDEGTPMTMVGFNGACPRFGRRSHFQSLSLSFSFFLTQVSQQILEGEPLHCWNYLQVYLRLMLVCVCVYAPAETGRHGLSAGINPISLNAPNYFYRCLL